MPSGNVAFLPESRECRKKGDPMLASLAMGCSQHLLPLPLFSAFSASILRDAWLQSAGILWHSINRPSSLSAAIHPEPSPEPGCDNASSGAVISTCQTAMALSAASSSTPHCSLPNKPARFRYQCPSSVSEAKRPSSLMQAPRVARTVVVNH